MAARGGHRERYRTVARACPLATLLAATALAATIPSAGARETEAYHGALPPPPRPEPAAASILFLELVVNGRSSGIVAAVGVEHGRYNLRLADLKRAGLLVDAVDDSLFLDELPGVTAQYDKPAQSLGIDVPASYLPQQRLGGRKRKQVAARTEMGALLSYDVYVSGGDRAPTQASLYHEARLFAVAGSLSSTGALRTGGGRTYVRYDTRFRRSDEATATTIEVGDFITRTLPWASAARLGGIQVSRDFSVRPDIITYPLPEFAGSAALPSTVELLVGGQRVAGAQVAPGPFAIDTLPPITGAGEANLIVTDMHGRSIAATLPFYVASELLAPGLTDFALAAGAFRENYGRRNFDYGGVAATASARHGLTAGVTLEVRAEIAEDMQLAGGGAMVKLGGGGVISGSYSRSFSDNGAGSQLTLGYEYQARLFSLALRHSRQSADYIDLGLIDAPFGSSERRISSATLSLVMGRAGTLGLGYFDVRRAVGADSRFANASWSLPLWRGGRLQASATREFEDRTWSGALTLSMALGGGDGSVSAGVFDAPGAPRAWRADYSRPLPTAGGFGWGAGAIVDEDGGHAWRGDIQWRGDAMALRAGAFGDGNATFWAGASGSLVFMDGAVFAANRVADAFAIVTTDGTRGIPVRYENQLIGHTGSGGRLLIPWTSAWYPGEFAIDPLGLPADVSIPVVSQKVAIAAGGGAVVRFPVERITPARAVLVGANGAPLPAGAAVRRQGEILTYTGWDGLLYIEQASPGETAVLTVDLPGGKSCTIRFTAPARREAVVIDLGELACETGR